MPTVIPWDDGIHCDVELDGRKIGTLCKHGNMGRWECSANPEHLWMYVQGPHPTQRAAVEELVQFDRWKRDNPDAW